MSPRFICPHCHSPLDPRSVETATSGDNHWRICPNCDEAIAQPQPDAAAARSGRCAPLAENAAR